MKSHLITKLVVSVLILTVLGFYTFSTPEKQDTSAMEDALALSQIPGDSVSRSVLGEQDENPIFFTVNVPSRFKKDISAPNIVYSITGGEGITVTEGQYPTLSNTGVLSLQDQTGNLSLIAGAGIEVSGLTISNTLSFIGSGGTTISRIGDSVTVSSSAPDYSLSGWSDNGTLVTLSTATDSVVVNTLTFGNATITNGKSIKPDTDLGSDLGSAAFRFNNLYVGNINSNSSTSTAGQATFTYEALSTALTEASVLINPTAPVANGQLLGLSVAGYQRALIDEDGDLTLGYNDAISAPANDYPLSVYGHNGTQISFIDTSGGAYFAGNVGIGTEGPIARLQVNGELTDPIFSVYDGYYSTNLGYGTRTTGAERLSLYKSNYVATLDNHSDSNPGASEFAFRINGAEKLRIDNNGNVGIGTTIPSVPLEINTTQANVNNYGLYLKDNSIGAALIAIKNSSLANPWMVGIQNGQSDFEIRQAGSADFYVITGNSERFRITDTGNIGIGTTSPSQRLDVNGNIISSGGIIITTGGSLSSFYSGQIQSGVASIGAGGAVGYGSNETVLWSGSGMPLVLGTAGTEHLRISSSGNVGIGTTDPITKLHIKSGESLLSPTNGGVVLENNTHQYLSFISPANTQQAIIWGAGNTNEASLSFEDGIRGNYMYLNPANYLGVRAGISVGGTYYPTTPPTDGLLVEGNVGIGEIAPTVKLDVNGTIMASALQVDDTNASMIQLESSLVLRGNEGIRFLDWSNSAWTERMRIDNVGNVGIGTSTPGFPLHVVNPATNASALYIKVENQAAAQPSYLEVKANSSKNVGIILTGYTPLQQWVFGMFGSNTFKIHDNVGAGSDPFQIEATSPTNSLYIDSSGYIGVGIDNPTYNLDAEAGSLRAGSLHVNGSSVYLSASGATGMKTLGGYFYVADGDLIAASTADFRGAVRNNVGNYLHIAGGTNGDTYIAGSLGINNTTPSYSLDVTGMMRATEGVVTYTKAGTISDVDFTETPIDGLMGVDSTNGRLYFRHGGAWHYVAQTAGFQIPEYETYVYDFGSSSFDTSSPLADGEFLIPFVEGRMSDGAIHGLYTSFSDVKDQLFADELSRILSLEERVTALEAVGLTTNPLLSSTGSIGSIATWTDTLWTFLGKVKVGGDTAGSVVATTGLTTVQYNFDSTYPEIPAVYLTPMDQVDGSFYVKGVTTTSFTVEMSQAQDHDVTFNWLAIIGSN